MTTTDILLYAGSGLTFAMAAATPLANIMFRRPRVREGGGESRPSFSIIIPAHENASELERHLPEFLSQEYDGDFEVIVVESKTGDRTEEVVKRLSSDKRLYSTFIPSSSKYMSRKKLAMTVGAKAAKYEWLIFADAECHPEGRRWLDAVARELGDDKDLAIGYGNYDDETCQFRRFVRLTQSLYALRKASKGRAFRAATDNVAIRRDVFMNGKGFEGNLMFVRGEYDFLVNKYAERGNTAVITSPLGMTRTDCPSEKTWKNTNLFYINARKHMQHGAGYRMTFVTDTVLMYLTYLLIAAGITTGILLDDIIVMLVSALSLILFVTERLVLAARTLKMYGEDISIIKVIPFEMMMMLDDIWFRIKHRFSDKNDFTSHKL